MRHPHLAVKTCAICERTLLTGERALRFSSDGRDYVDVCPLCQEIALEQGWIREGEPTTPVLDDRRRRRLPRLGSIFEQRRQHAAPETASTPEAPSTVRRRATSREAALAEAADVFNSSPFRRTVAGIAKSLGEPLASLVVLSGVNREVVVTIAWDISWYQYRVSFDSIQPVRLAERGYELDELDPSFKRWNASVADDGSLVTPRYGRDAAD